MTYINDAMIENNREYNKMMESINKENKSSSITIIDINCPKCGSKGQCIVDQEYMLTKYLSIYCKVCGEESVLEYNIFKNTMR